MSERYGIGGGRWRAVRARVLREERECWLCGVELDLALPREHPQAAQVDHVIPLAQGGDPYDRANLRAACRSCNRAKGDGRQRQRPEPRTFVTTRKW